MDRRNFFKIVSAVSASAASTSCSRKVDPLIPLLVPDRELIPGEERWHPSLCGECKAGCGTLVRVMEGERIIERNQEKFRERIACIKKIEGNPLDPVSGGRLCARGHAALQSLYNPDRLHEPLRRTGARGENKFTSVSWDDAIAVVAEKLAKVRASDASRILFLTNSQPGTRTLSIERFLKGLGAPAAFTCSLDSLAVERKAAELAFGWKGVPRYDLAQARYALGVGADFLGGWASPVYYARQFGHFRQGRPSVRGTLVHAESRMSITAASADEWLPVRPGFEPHLIIAIARLLLDANLERDKEQLSGPEAHSILSADLNSLIRSSGIEEKHLRRVARELGESEAPLVIAGASTLHTNSLDALIAAHHLNFLLGNVGRPGGVFPPNPELSNQPQHGGIVEALKRAQVLFLDGDDPLYVLPSSSGASQALANVETIVSFGNFINDSAAHADLILPDHHFLESATAVLPVVSPKPAITVAMPFVRPLYNTREMEQTMADIARKMNIAYEPATPNGYVEPLLPAGETWDNVARRGGLWLDDKGEAAPAQRPSVGLKWSDPVITGDPERFPLLFQPYLSLQYHDGRGANLPWMQELPDPVSSSMWNVPLEVDPKTAAKLDLVTGDWVRVESNSGSLEVLAYVHPAALPGVVSMAIGEGHTHYGRFASGRGTNPLSILAPVWENSTGALASGATRVRVTRLEKRTGELIQFSPRDREQGPWGHR